MEESVISEYMLRRPVVTCGTVEAFAAAQEEALIDGESNESLAFSLAF
jgi:hypothetical protein